MKYLSVFSGMEAASVAWEPLGWKPVGFSEIEPFPSAILKHRFPNTLNYGNITQYNEWPIESGSVDLLVGGSPCQSFSVAGLRKGMQDPRGNLALTFLGLADKLKPKWIVWENVPGVLSSNGGRDFGSFLGALGELGYGYAYRILDASHFGVPQRRRRVFVVAYLGDWRPAAEVLFEPESLRGDTSTSRKKRERTTASVETGVGAEGQSEPNQFFDKQALGEYSQQGIASTCAARDYKDASDLIISPTVTTCKGSRGGSSSEAIEEIIAVHNAESQSIPFRKSKRAQSATDDETWVADGKANTLNNFDLGDTRTTHAVVEPLMFKIRGGSPVETGEQGGTPGKAAGKGFLGSVDKAFTVATAQDQWLAQPIAIQGTIIGRGENAGPQGIGASEGGPMFTLTKTDIHGVCCQKLYENHPNDSRVTGPHDVAPTVVSRFGTGGGNVPLVNNEQKPIIIDRAAFNQGVNAQYEPHIAESEVMDSLVARGPHAVGQQNKTTMAVRRLTPVECERLQGFPDNWSRIPWKNKPEEDCPDGPRYKACGNSMAVPVMRWIGQKINLIDNKIKTK